MRRPSYHVDSLHHIANNRRAMQSQLHVQSIVSITLTANSTRQVVTAYSNVKLR
jgi:hypothetical protein